MNKTAEEVLKDHTNEEGFYDISEMILESSSYRVESTIEGAMKAYGRQCAEQALKDAAEKFHGIHMKDGYGCTCDVPNAILSTPIVTP